MRLHDDNRRKYPRADLVVAAEVRCEYEQKSFHVRTKNIGAGGICVVLPEMLPAGTQLCLSLRLPDADAAFEVAGKVVWTLRQRKLLKKKPGGFDTGIEFVDIEQQDRDRLIRIAQDYIF